MCKPLIFSREQTSYINLMLNRALNVNLCEITVGSVIAWCVMCCMWMWLVSDVK